jgi:CRISPR-associated protein Cmr3
MASPLPGWPYDDRMPLWADHEPDAKKDRDWVTLGELGRFLADPDHDIRTEHLIPDRAVTGPDDRVGIEIDYHSFTAADHQLYAVRFQALNPRLREDDLGRAKAWGGAAVVYYAELILPTGAAADPFADPTPVPFGGEGRYAGVRRVPGVEWPQPPPGTTRTLVYLASPAVLPGDPPLPRLDGGRLIAAASGAGVAVSGWDVARNGPRPTRFAVPAGACYFYDGTPDLPDDSIDPDDDNRREGWGFSLRGTW